MIKDNRFLNVTQQDSNFYLILRTPTFDSVYMYNIDLNNLKIGNKVGELNIALIPQTIKFTGSRPSKANRILVDGNNIKAIWLADPQKTSGNNIINEFYYVDSHTKPNFYKINSFSIIRKIRDADIAINK